jgi:protein ImuB
MRIACLHVPSFSLAAWCRTDPELAGEAVAVVEGSGPRAIVVAVSPAAERHGIVRGLSAAQATARYAKIVLRPRSADAERAAQAALCDAAYTFSPRVEDAGEGTVYLEIDGSQALHGTESELAHALVRRARQLGLEVSAGVASTKIAAQLAARHGEGITVIPRDEEWRYLAPLPIHLLAPSPALQEAFARWGLRCLGDLAALPASAVATRLGPEAARLARRARGEDEHPLVVRPAPIRFEEAAELDHGIETLEPFLFVLRALLDRLINRLAVRGFICGDLRLWLGLTTRGCDERTIAVAAPSNDIKALLTLVRLRLEAHPPPAPVERIRLAAVPERLRPAQLDMFRPHGPAPEQLAVTIARLTALCGAERLGTPVVADSHRPDAYGLAPFQLAQPGFKGPRVQGSKGLPSNPRNLEPSNPLSVALRAIRPPRPLEAFHNRGRLDYLRLARAPGAVTDGCGCSGRVVTAAGPWRVQGEWWSPEPYCRDYYDVQLSDGGVYRVYHDLHRDVWFVEGAYD